MVPSPPHVDTCRRHEKSCARVGPCWLAANKQARDTHFRAFACAESEYFCAVALASCLTHRSTFAQTQLRPGVSVVAVSTCQLVAAAVVAAVTDKYQGLY